MASNIKAIKGACIKGKHEFCKGHSHDAKAKIYIGGFVKAFSFSIKEIGRDKNHENHQIFTVFFKGAKAYAVYVADRKISKMYDGQTAEGKKPIAWKQNFARNAFPNEESSKE